MPVGIVLELMNRYGTCRKCGSSSLGNGKGALIIEDDLFIRKCECGWSIQLNTEEAEKELKNV